MGPRSLTQLVAFLILLLAPQGAARGAIGFPLTEDPGRFEALGPILETGELVLLEHGAEGLTRVTILARVKGDADDILSLVATPALHKDMSEGVEKIVLLPPDGGTLRFETHIDTPGPNTQVDQRMDIGPGRTLHIESSGSVSGRYSWRFTPLEGGYTGVEYSLYADIVSMGAMMKWVANRAPSIQTGANAVTGLISVTGLRRLLHVHRGVPLPEEGGTAPLAIGAHWSEPRVAAALTALTSVGTLACVGGGDTVIIDRRGGSPEAIRGAMLTEAGHYPLKLVTPVRTYEVTVQQYPQGATAIFEKVEDGGAMVLEWTWDFLPLPGGETLLSLRSTIDISQSFVMRLAMGLDPAVGPALRLAASLSPWDRAAP